MSELTASAPEPIFNCPECSHYLPPGSLACPECKTLAYAGHLNQVGRAAQSLEAEGKWAEARETWYSALTWLPPDSQQTTAIRTHVAEIEAKLHSGEVQKAKWTKRLGPLAPIAVFLAKFKTAIFFLFKLKFLLSFFAFFGLYWVLFGWKFGLGFTLCILIHEMGHYIAARSRGLKVDLPFFLPGLGAYVRWYNQGVSLGTISFISLAGPFFGLLAAGACAGLFAWSHNTLFLALAYSGAWLNLLNLIPVLGLDGAQATYALNRLQRGMILVACLVLFGLIHQFVFLFIAIGMGWRLFTHDAPQQPHTLTLAGFLGLLFSLAAFLYLIPLYYPQQ